MKPAAADRPGNRHSEANASAEKPIIEMFLDRARQQADRVALHVPGPDGYGALTWGMLAQQLARAALVLESLGVSAGDRVVQVSPNRREWLVCDLALQWLQAVHVPVHATLTGPQIAYQIMDSGARVVILSGPDQASKLADEQLADAKTLHDLTWLAFDPCEGPLLGQTVQSFSTLLDQVTDGEVAQRLAAPLENRSLDELATIIYTSGTTGEPKGVMLTHGNLSSNAVAQLEVVDCGPADVRLGWLPLSHIFARTCDFYAWIVAGCELALAASRETILANCAQIQPTIINGVPYFYEKLQRYLVDQKLDQTPGTLQRLLGGRMRFCCSGGAALPDHVARFFADQGVLLVQGYGLTETSPVICTGFAAAHRIGTVGVAIRDVQIKIAPDGEILTKGPHVMRGYWNKPTATAEVLKEGWFYTGDLGEIDDEGFLKITGRKKELIVTAAGKNIAPALLESLLTADPLIQQAVVFGDARNYLVALIVPDQEALKREISAQQITLITPADVFGSAEVRQLIAARLRTRLATVSHCEQIGRFVLMPEPFTVESGELTPTLKLRRGVIAKNHGALIESMYAERSTAGQF